MEDSDDDSLIMAGMQQSDDSDAAGSDEEDYFEFNGDLSSEIAPDIDDIELFSFDEDEDDDDLMDTETTSTTNKYREARKALSPYIAVNELPGRETERDEIYNIVRDHLDDELGCCIYVSGVPGTGKTATVRHVIAQLQREVSAREVNEFVWIEINAMKLTSPNMAYSVLWQRLTDQKQQPKKAQDLLDKRFKQRDTKRPMCVVLLDEIDQLVTRNQLVLYNLFDWPRRAHSKLIVIGIANTMDLPERLLPKVHSRLGLQRVSFAAYNSAQLEQIARQRLGSYVSLFDAAALLLVARKVAATTADARRALEVLRRALLLAERECEARSNAAASATTTSATSPVLVTARVVDAALGALLARAKCPALRSAPRHARLLVATAARLSGTVTVAAVLERYAAQCHKWQVAPLGPSQLRAVLSSLAACRLLTCEHDRVVLCIERDDMLFALSTDDLALKFLNE